MNRIRFSILLVLAVALTLVVPSGDSCQGQTASREYAVKAAFLYNFAQFVEWPGDAFSGPDAPIIIGVVGEDPFGGLLEQAVRDKKVGGRPLVIQRFHDAGSLRFCHILYVAPSESEETAQVLAKAGQLTLAVGDFESFTARGGTFRFLLEDNRVRFEVNVAATHKLRIKISSKLLKLARVYGQ
jgi:hypothetical protein